MNKRSKLIKRLSQILGLLIMLVFLAGCVKRTADGEPTGFVYKYIGIPTSKFMDWLAQIFNGSYGIAIIIITLLTRLIMLPGSLKMQRDNMFTQTKMKLAQKEIEEIQKEAQEANARGDQQAEMELNNELMGIYKKYDINPTAGCTSGMLPLLLQLPILSAVYAAIESSQAIKESTFLGIHLGQSKSIPVTIAVAVVYLIQSWLQKKSTEAMQAEQNQDEQNEQAAQMASQMNAMYLMNPIMLGWLSYQSNAGLGLYFLSGGVFFLIQQLVTDYILKPRTQAKVDEEMKKYENLPKRKPRAKSTHTKKADGSTRLVPTKRNTNTKQGRRNEGKQRKRKK